MNPSRFRNYINKDPILDLLKLSPKYTRDCDLPGFDSELLLETYIKKNKKLFIEKIQESLGDDCIKIGYDSFLMKTRNLKKHFKSPSGFDPIGNNYSFLTIEYSSILSLKNGDVSTSHRYYNFKNWLLSKEINKKLDYSFVIGRKYKNYDNFNLLVPNPHTFEGLLEQAEHHLETIGEKEIGVELLPNMSNTSDYPYHNAKKLILKEFGQKVKKRSGDFFKNFNNLELPTGNLLFIDFELLSSIYETFETFPKANDKNVLFNIGCVSKFGNLSLMASSLSDEERIFKMFVGYIESIGDNVTLVHWTNIEKRIFNEKIKEFGIELSTEIVWFDLHDYFKKSDVYIEDCENLKLKTVSRCLHKKGCIKSTWEPGQIFDGVGAMTSYIKYLGNGDKTILEFISKYNLVDCQVLYEIFTYISSELSK